ncbi:hypothetical protein Esi_0074_0069 [Ectocarpus siliculosus]|uniref:Uncharacterized protein n=1 Tax=Ectocarpus siliculosus TaxID=2880 RepID=D8LSL1_ECTSI|nr:hypothetical protein Esi_0074_0069 [Ectocarpus siliculosus]|eukprot:CBN77848.1 hypothetical protein Esi_0074_0069 [Ectocarpus siliculosus]
MEEEAPFRPTPTPPLPPPQELVPLESKAMPSYNRGLKSFAGEESNNNAPMEVFVPTLQADMDTPFLAFLTKLSLVARFDHARAPPSPPPVKEISRNRDGGRSSPGS